MVANSKLFSLKPDHLFKSLIKPWNMSVSLYGATSCYTHVPFGIILLCTLTASIHHLHASILFLQAISTCQTIQKCSDNSLSVVFTQLHTCILFKLNFSWLVLYSISKLINANCQKKHMYKKIPILHIRTSSINCNKEGRFNITVRKVPFQ